MSKFITPNNAFGHLLILVTKEYQDYVKGVVVVSTFHPSDTGREMRILKDEVSEVSVYNPAALTEAAERLRSAFKALEVARAYAVDTYNNDILQEINHA